jgi:hypothetical protein
MRLIIIPKFSTLIKTYVGKSYDNYVPNAQATVRVKPKEGNLSWRLPSVSSVIESN